MNAPFIAKCGGVVLLGAFILTCGLEVLENETIYNGKLTASIWENYKLTLWQILYAFGWMTGLGISIQMVFICYNGGKMTYLFTVESVEKATDLFHNRLPTMELVYSSSQVPKIADVPVPEVTLQQRTEVTLPTEISLHRRRRSPRNR